MSKQKIYRVTFDTKENRCCLQWVFITWAPNAKVACETVKNVWTRHPHQFHMKAALNDVQTLDALSITNYKGIRRDGPVAMGKFIIV